jgi:hypothetical protein
MDHPAGASLQRAERLDFDARVRLEFHGTQISSDGGLLVMRELGDALGLSDLASAALRDCRTGKNRRCRDLRQRAGQKIIVQRSDSDDLAIKRQATWGMPVQSYFPLPSKKPRKKRWHSISGDQKCNQNAYNNPSAELCDACFKRNSYKKNCAHKSRANQAPPSHEPSVDSAQEQAIEEDDHHHAHETEVDVGFTDVANADRCASIRTSNPQICIVVSSFTVVDRGLLRK